MMINCLIIIHIIGAKKYDECIYGRHEHDCDKCKLEWLQSIRKER